MPCDDGQAQALPAAALTFAILSPPFGQTCPIASTTQKDLKRLAVRVRMLRNEDALERLASAILVEIDDD